MKHCLLTCLFILCTTLLAQAQSGSLSGKVTTLEAKPVEDAIVLIKNLNKVAVTDQNGFYRFNDIPFGTYHLEVNAIAVELKQVEIAVNQPETLSNIAVKAKGGKALKEVLVTGKTEKREIETVGFAVNVVETKEASLRNLQTNELLNRTVGVKVRQSGGLGSEAVYNLNGMSGRAVGIFIDGIEISTYGSSFNLNNIPPALIERIEVYKGVLPAHLSGDFLGGGINIILKKGALQNNLTASVAYGSFNTQQADLGGMYRNPKSGLTIKGSGFYSYSDNDYKVWGKFVKNEMPSGQMLQGRGKRFNDAFKSFGGR
ncbi:MAG: TonB-dependent receptor plug domain-containing protein, partial [Adhaeribacter sp.]